MCDLSYYTNSTVDNVLTPGDIRENCHCIHTQHNSRQVGLSTIRLLVDPYTTCGSSIELPHDYEAQCDTAMKLAEDLMDAAAQHLKPTQKDDQGFDKKSQRQLAKLRQRFLEQTISVFQMVEDTASKILVEAGFTGHKNEDSGAKNLRNRVLGQIQDAREYFEKALRHNQTLSDG